jgi:uncharacterized protein YdeI (BOF family)
MLKNINLKWSIGILLAFALALFFIIAACKGLVEPTLWEFIKILPIVLTFVMILVGLFIKWGWRIKYVQGWLVLIPNLNGTWGGDIQTNWENPETDETPGPIPVILSIKQSLVHISCVMRTAEMTSYSFAEEFKLDKGRQVKQLVYTYSSKPLNSVADRSAQHDGSMIFDIIGNPVEKLKGQYWTARKTTGEITLIFRERKLLDEMPNDLGNHPLSE